MTALFGDKSRSGPSLFSDGSAPQHASHGHGILHNLLQDAIDTAKGIPFGMVQTVEHPVRTVKAVGHSYADTYGHGWGHFWKEFHAHPLQPLLDAISVPLMLAGGAGAALKGADIAANVGRGAEVSAALSKASDLAAAGKFAEADAIRYGASRAPKLTELADYARKGSSKTTRMVKTPVPGLELPKAYSSNFFRAALTKGSDAILEGIGGVRPESKFGQVFSEQGLGRRLAAKDRARREAATAAEAKGQAHVLTGARRAGLEAGPVQDKLIKRVKDTIMAGGHRISEADAAKLAGNENAMAHYQFIERDSNLVPTFDPKTGQYVEHLEKWNADELSRAGLRVKNADQIQFYHSRPADSLYRDESGALTTRERQAGVADMPKQGKVNELQWGAKHESAFIKSLGKVYTYTNDPAKAMRDANGNLILVRKGIGDRISREIEGTAKLANAVYRAPLTAWKAFILAGAPRYFVNNVVGNAGMFAAATNPVEFSRGVIEAVRSVRGIRAAAKLERQMGHTLDSLMAKYLPDEVISGHFSFLQHGALGLDQTVGFAQQGHLGRLRSGLYPITEKVSYRGPQRASLLGAMTTMPEFRNLLRSTMKAHPNMSRYEAFQVAAKKLVADPRKAAALEKRTTDWAGQYYHLNGVEKAITAFVPFYNWDRHALRFGKEQVLSRPVSSIVLSQLGALGDKQASKELGKLPDFMKGAIPVGGHSGGVLSFLLGQEINGRKKVIMTSGYNPLAAAAEDAHAIAALVGGGHPSEALGGQLNPVVSGAISGITGQQVFSGAKAKGLNAGPVHVGGPVGEALNETFGQLPQKRLLEAAASGEDPSTVTSSGNQTLYTHSARQQLSSLLGLNERDFSPQAAERLYRQEHGIKKGRRAKGRHARNAARQFGSKSRSNSLF